MKTFLRPMLGLVSIVLLASCAGTHELSRSTAPAAVPASATPMTKDDIYVARIEEIARRRGVQVVSSAQCSAQAPCQQHQHRASAALCGGRRVECKYVRALAQHAIHQILQYWPFVAAALSLPVDDAHASKFMRMRLGNELAQH